MLATTMQHHHEHPAEEAKGFFATYKPLLLVGGFIILATALVEIHSGSFDSHRSMQVFMGGFFLFFSFFKFLNLSGFAGAFATYDVIAKKSRAYAVAYPFLELSLGVAYILGWQLDQVNVLTAALMIIGSIGVWQALRKKQTIQCACLGTIFNLPMTKITLFENSLMLTMALIALV